MKKIFLLCLITQLLWAQSTIIQSKIESVTVFLNGAQVTRSAYASLPIGKTELVFKGISPQINKQSIQVKSESKFTILSVNHQLGSLLDKAIQEEITKIENQKRQLEDKINLERNYLLLFKREEEMLLKNQVVGGQQAGMKVTDLKESVEYQRQRMQEVLMKKLEYEKNIQRLEDEVKKLNQQLTEINAKKDVQMSEIVIKVLAKETINNAPITISYFVKNAGWTPTYDFRVEKLNQPISLAYKANIFQYSGEDWKEVKLSLSTANPYKSGTAPVLQKWVVGEKNDYSDYYNNIVKGENESINANQSEVWGRVTTKSDKLGIPGVSITLKGTTLGIASDVNGNYRLTVPPTLYNKQSTLVFSAIGYQTIEKTITSSRTDAVLDESVAQLNEVVVTGYEIGGLTLKSNRDYNKRTIPIDISERDAPTSQVFDILVPYTIPSDGKVYTAEIKEESIPAIFEHFCIPKIDTDVFLHAHIIGWEKYKLLQGEANLFIDNTFLGKSKLNLFNKDTLSLSFGRDKNVIISRNKLKSYQKKQLIGSNKSEQFSYEIVARNTKNEVINLLIEDQFPVSENKEVNVEDKEAPEAEINTETGKIKWKLNLAPAIEYKVSLKYTIKSPKSGFVTAE
ncbi:mucoidy inhibitor MuiA family protein [Emticicia sp. C21]|uniref:mucoidy inhibitor MuiA family protein n=1 Tax=Emticicia sp. C21 TaxID=2302915 RepID=UPI000E35587A|nr:mucoidy inhibitor MuiA family protein [Emticicia sp. C21]RFS17984.1 mucoidy inhibitor MuiA family protein [Emticicia sp. C21]